MSSIGFQCGGVAALVLMILFAIMLFETSNEDAQMFYWLAIISAALVMFMCYVGYRRNGALKDLMCDNYEPLKGSGSDASQQRNPAPAASVPYALVQVDERGRPLPSSGAYTVGV
jgi:heme A synthase